MEKIAEKESENGTCDVIFYEQEDCAGCHVNEEYIEWKTEEFKKESG